MGAFSRRNEPGSPLDNLPLQLSSLVGREREIAEVEELLGSTRLLTLTGPGGSGKTRLALAVGNELVEGFENGVWLVKLAPLSDPDLVPQAVASVLGIRETPGTALVDSLCVHLASREPLLVLDNCEHLVGACASLVETLVRSCPRLRILATSREALGVRGETLFAVPPLSLPDPRRLSAMESLGGYEAARLFVERARAVRPEFEITEQNAMAVAQICYRLDGIPLAIELAAARVKMLSAEQIASRMDESFRLLSGGGRTAMPHHRTLRATMDWSHELLGEDERTLFRKLCVFAGGFTLEAGEAVGSGGSLEENEVLEVLSQLADKSLVLVMEQDGEIRYRLLEMVRQYGRDLLWESGEEEATRERHATWCLAFAEEAERGLSGPDQAWWLTRLETELDNLRIALQWSLEENAVAELGLRLAASLWSFWLMRGYLSEGRKWLESGISRSSPTTTLAKALNVVGSLALSQGKYGEAIVSLERSVDLYRELEDSEGLASSLANLGFAAMLGERADVPVQALLEEAMRLRPELRDPSTVATVLAFAGMVTGTQGQWNRAAALYEEGLALYREVGEPGGILSCLQPLGIIALIQADYQAAAPLLRESLHLACEVDYKVIIQYSFFGLGAVASGQGHPTRAARLWAATEVMNETYGTTLSPMVSALTNHEDRLSAVRAQLGEEEFAAGWSEGRAMPPEQAIEYALERPTTPRTDAPPAYPLGLSAREVEVIALLAKGMTNARIAKELYISPRTVNAHLRSIYHKLGFSTRAEATRFASEYGLL